MHSHSSRIRAAAALTIVALAVACTSKGTPASATNDGAAQTVGADVVDADAVAILKGAATYLRDAKSLQVVARTGFDVVQSDGRRLEFGATREMAIQRPNRARIEFARRDGKQGVVVFDGNDIWVHSPTHEVYARAPQPGDVDAGIAYLTEELGISAPLADLFTSDVGSTLAEGLRSCSVVGDAIVSGAACHHVSVRNDYVDFQLWIAKSEQPVPRRIVITYREEPGQPQFWADLDDWKVGASMESRMFVFQPPAGADRIQFHSIQPAAAAPSPKGE